MAVQKIAPKQMAGLLQLQTVEVGKEAKATLTIGDKDTKFTLCNIERCMKRTIICNFD